MFGCGSSDQAPTKMAASEGCVLWLNAASSSPRVNRLTPSNDNNGNNGNSRLWLREGVQPCRQSQEWLKHTQPPAAALQAEPARAGSYCNLAAAYPGRPTRQVELGQLRPIKCHHLETTTPTIPSVYNTHDCKTAQYTQPHRRAGVLSRYNRRRGATETE